MAEVITMLALSPTMDEGTLVEWLKGEGDEVAEGDLIAEIETDKATMEMESFFEGTLLKVLAKKGDAIPVGAPLAIIGEEGEDISDVLAGLGDGGGEAASTPAESDASTAAADTSTAAPAAPKGGNDGRLKASPLARRIAADKGVDLTTIQGSGPNGRIIKRDVEGAQPAQAKAQASAPAPVYAPPAAAETTEVPLSQMRKTIAKRLVQVWQQTPHFYLTMSIDMEKAMSLRKEINAQLAAAEAGVKISVNDMIVKACGVAMRNYPKMNVSYQGDHLVQYGDVHIGVAVAIEDGLITPVIRNVDQRSLSAIATDVRELAGRAREKRLKPDEYTGSTFSVSNLGMYGIHEFNAIINPPEAAILACGAVEKVPVVVDGELAVGTRMNVTLSCDHRAIDGAVGSEFLIEVKRLLENPFLLFV